jgi:hypothetical protein
MIVREPIAAGRFYDAQPERCRNALRQLLGTSTANLASCRSRAVAGLVPHAGWVCSGAVAAQVYQTLAASHTPATIVVFGGVHRHRGKEAAMFVEGRWETPLGPVEVDARLAERVMGHTNLVVNDAYAHDNEHSIEVQMPFLRYVFPEAKVLPIMVPPGSTADEVGDAVGRTLTTYNYDAIVVGTTDLTHYGPNYGFTPEGVGAAGNEWAKNVNDLRFVDLVCTMQADRVVAEAREHKNACSSGAAAATIAAAKCLGATEGVVLNHTSSGEVLAERMKTPQDDSVGYVGIVFS